MPWFAFVAAARILDTQLFASAVVEMLLQTEVRYTGARKPGPGRMLSRLIWDAEGKNVGHFLLLLLRR
jgi:hypothetical protein